MNTKACVHQLGIKPQPNILHIRKGWVRRGWDGWGEGERDLIFHVQESLRLKTIPHHIPVSQQQNLLNNKIKTPLQTASNSHNNASVMQSHSLSTVPKYPVQVACNVHTLLSATDRSRADKGRRITSIPWNNNKVPPMCLAHTVEVNSQDTNVPGTVTQYPQCVSLNSQPLKEPLAKKAS